ncbi:MAG: amidohydrolase family protein [Planctomycetota bacterium]|nr:amidohydrolase family protein [Planctomycetota bacterium]MEC9157656.1 amidohydrolase family protein [Planctomycetota bacterium]MEC9234273.1 amidohydrolase family protein [Planctomycetota bacterium]MED5507665.1 amidohydrolase family protein [Planctomycetota bacterium]
MIVDINTRCWSSPNQLGSQASDVMRQVSSGHWLRGDHGPDALLEQIDCVDVAVIHGFRSQMLEANVPNEFIAELVSRHPERLIGIAGIDPLQKDSRKEMEQAIELGLSGISVSPSMQGLHPTHSSAMMIYEACEAKRMPVMVSRPEVGIPQSVLEFDRPLAWDEVARTFPKLKIVIGGVGFPWVEETLMLLQKHENIFADLSFLTRNPWATWNALLNAQAIGESSTNVMDRLLFASGWPAQTPAAAIERLYSLNSFSQGSNLPTIPRTTIHSIIERDSLEALGIERGALSGVVPPRQNVIGAPAAGEGFATEASQQSLNN